MRLLLLPLLVVLALPVASAQDANPNATHTVVTYTLQSTIVNPDEVPVPEMLTRLAEQPRLADLEVSRAHLTHQIVRARFVFNSVAEYVAWRESEPVVSLHDDLKSEGGNLSAAVSMRRHPLVRHLEDEG